MSNRVGCFRHVGSLVLLVLVFTLAPGPVHAAAETNLGAIEGVVLSASGQPLPGVTLALISEFSTNRSTITQQDGRFRFSLVAPGIYKVEVTHALRDEQGYEYATVRQVFENVLVRAGQTTNISMRSVVSSQGAQTNMVIRLPLEVRGAEVSLWSDSNLVTRINLRQGWRGDEVSVNLAMTEGSYRVGGRASYVDGELMFDNFTVDVNNADGVTDLTVPPIQGSVRIRVSDPLDGTQLNGPVTLIQADQAWEVTYSSLYGDPDFDRYPPVPPGRYVVEFPVVVDSVPVVVWDVIDVVDGTDEFIINVPSVDSIGTVKAKLVDVNGRFVVGKADTVAEKIDIPNGRSVERPLMWVVNEFGDLAINAAAGRHHWVIRYGGQEEHIEADVKANAVTDLGTVIVGPDPEPPAAEERPEDPAPPAPPAAPPGDAPQPAEPPGFEISEDAIRDHTDPNKPVVVIEVPKHQPVYVRPQVGDLLREAGQALHLGLGNAGLTVNAGLLDLERWSEANPEVKDFLTRHPEDTVRFRVSVEEVQLPDPPGDLMPAGGAYQVRWEVVGPDGTEVAPARWPEPVYVSAPLPWTGRKDTVAVWQLGSHGDAAPRPSWVSGETIRFTAQHPGTYVVGAREARFRDVEGHWARDVIGAAYAHGIVRGADPQGTRFDPDRPVTRVEFAAMVSRALGFDPDPAAAANFADVRNTWAAGLVGAVHRAGVTHGLRPGYFGASELLTRLQLAVMLGRALESKGVAVPAQPHLVLASFRDGASVPAWAERPLAIAVAAGVVRGDGRGFLHPNDHATRAETAAMAIRFLRAWFESVAPQPELN